MSGIKKLFFGIILVFIAVFSGASVNAFSNDPKTFVSGDNVFYAYVETGEKVDIKFSKSSQPEPSGIPGKQIIVTIEAPGMTAQTCVIPPNVALGGGCNLSLTAAKNGIWRINFQLPPDAHVHQEVATSVKWNGNLFNWSIKVSNSGVERTGRLWSELYAIRQPAPASFLTDMTLHYVSEDGYLYRVNYKGYNGQLSTLSADAFGIITKGTCETAYRSVNTKNLEYVPSFGTCGGNYKLFFEQLSDDLPTEAVRWDGATEWVRPNIDRPLVESLKFTPDKAIDRQSGLITYSLKNFVGQYEVRIDTNGDKNYDGPNDITLKRQIKNLKDSGKKTIKFDGMDKKDNLIPRDQQISIKINIIKSGEIHLVGADIEGREGGLELVRLSGDNVPTFTVCWNDAELGAATDGLGSELVIDGTSCPDSRGGVHKWKYNEGSSWGNARYIDDWVYTSARVKGQSEIIYPESLATMQTAAVQRNYNMVIFIVVLIALLVLTVWFILWRRRRAKQDRNALNSPSELPTDQPPLP